MKALIVPLIAVLGLGACATNRLSDTDRLALYDAHAGAPVKQIASTTRWAGIASTTNTSC